MASKKKEIKNTVIVSSPAAWALSLYPDRMQRLIAASVGAQWVQAKFEIQGNEYTIRAQYRRGTVTLSAPTEA